MKHLKLFLLEDLFNVRDLDYVDSFSELFRVFSFLKYKNYIDRDGNLTLDIDSINNILNKKFGFDDEWFFDENDYQKQLDVVKKIIKENTNKL
jgi:hypothetical protein